MKVAKQEQGEAYSLGTLRRNANRNGEVNRIRSKIKDGSYIDLRMLSHADRHNKING